MFTAGFNARHAEDEKISLGDEGKVSVKFADGNASPNICYPFDSVDFDAFDRGLQDSLAPWR